MRPNNLTKRKIHLTLLIVFFNLFTAWSQEVSNIRVEQSGDRVQISYDISGEGRANLINLFFSVDNGQSWTGPLKQVSGDISNIRLPATAKAIHWNGRLEFPGLEGEVIFKITADVSGEIKTSDVTKIAADDVKPWSYDKKYTRTRGWKQFYTFSGIVSAGAAGYSFLKANSIYNEYPTATSELDVMRMRERVQLLDNIFIPASIVAGLSTVGIISSGAKMSKIKRQFNINSSLEIGSQGFNLAIVF